MKHRTVSDCYTLFNQGSRDRSIQLTFGNTNSLAQALASHEQQTKQTQQMNKRMQHLNNTHLDPDATFDTPYYAR